MDWEARLEEARLRRAEVLSERQPEPEAEVANPDEILEDIEFFGALEDMISEEELPASMRRAKRRGPEAVSGIDLPNSTAMPAPVSAPHHRGAASDESSWHRTYGWPPVPGASGISDPVDGDTCYGLAQHGWVGLREGQVPPLENERWVPPMRNALEVRGKQSSFERMIVARAEAETFAVNFERARSKEREMALGLWSPDPAFENSNPAIPQVGSVFGPKVMSIAGFAVLGLCVGALYNLNGGAATRAGAVIAPPAMVSTSSLGDVGLPSVAKMVPSILSVVEVPARPTGATLFPVSPEGAGKTAGEAGAASAYRVRLFVPDGVSGPDRANAAERVATGDSTLDRIVPVDYPVRTTHVRFYHPADRGEAERIARLAGGEARDFTLAGVDPPEGYLELYLRGEGAED